MSFVPVDLSNVGVATAGEYLVNIEKYEVKESGAASKNPGSQYLNWTFRTEDDQLFWRNLYIFFLAINLLRSFLNN